MQQLQMGGTGVCTATSYRKAGRGCQIHSAGVVKFAFKCPPDLIDINYLT
jgi:hypothetical protein